MSRLKKILIALVLFCVLVVVIGLFLPSSVSIDRRTVIAARADAIHSHLNDFKRWTAWSPFDKADEDDPDEEIVYTYSGEESGVGARVSFTTKKMGDGMMRITESEPRKGIVYEISFDGGKSWFEGRFDLEDGSEGSTEVSWKWNADFGFNLIYRYTMIAARGTLEKSWDLGLARLKVVAERESGAGADAGAGQTEAPKTSE